MNPSRNLRLWLSGWQKIVANLLLTSVRPLLKAGLLCNLYNSSPKNANRPLAINMFVVTISLHEGSQFSQNSGHGRKY